MHVRAIYGFMDANQATRIFTITAMCRVFKVSRRAFYDWRRRVRQRNATAEVEERAVKQQLRTLDVVHNSSYGVNRMTAEVKQQFPEVGRRRVYGFMQDLGIQGRSRRRRWKTTVSDHRPHGIPDLVKRNFVATRPRELVVCDATAIALENDVAYLAIVLDVYSRKIVGWALDPRQSTELMISALSQATARGACDNMICHSDQGSQYTSQSYQHFCITHGLQQSTGSVGDCFDNAMAESFFGRFKTECIVGRSFPCFDDAYSLISRYMNRYNEDRRHSGIGYQTPNQIERTYFKELANT